MESLSGMNTVTKKELIEMLSYIKDDDKVAFFDSHTCTIYPVIKRPSDDIMHQPMRDWYCLDFEGLCGVCIKETNIYYDKEESNSDIIITRKIDGKESSKRNR